MTDQPTTFIKSVLSFFKDVETMTIPDAPPLGKGFGRSSAYPGPFNTTRAPWNTPQINAFQTTFYTVHLGVTQKRTLVNNILDLLTPDVPVDDITLDEVSGTASVGSMVLDWEGRPLVEYIKPAPFLYAVRQLQQSGKLKKLDEDIKDSVTKAMTATFGNPVPLMDPFAPSMDDIEKNETLTEYTGNGKHRVYEKSASIKALLAVSKGLMRVANLPADTVEIRVVSHVIKGKKRKSLSLPAFEDNMVPSFYAADIGRVQKKTKDIQKTALFPYLQSPTSEHTRLDVLTNHQAMASLLDPKTLTQARWPTNPHHSLNIAQQAAVGSIINNTQPLIAVNGPPGTGKTTLLRDVIAQSVLARADRLVDLQDPSYGIETRMVTPKNKDMAPFELSLVDSHLVAGTSVFVASNNNAAVENISLELPQVKTIDTRTFSTASYLKTAANELANTDKTPQRKQSTQNTTCWGLMALRMGNRDNINTVLEGLNPFVKDNSQKRGLVESLRRMKPITTAEWHQLCEEYTTTKEAVTTYLDTLCESWARITRIPYLKDWMDTTDLLTDSLQTLLPIASHHKRLRTHLGHEDVIVSRAFFAAHKDSLSKARTTAQKESTLHGLARYQYYATAIKRAELEQAILSTFMTLPNDTLFDQPFEDLQRSSVWTHPELEKARSTLFLKAMALHEGFWRWNWQKLYGLLKGTRLILTGEAGVNESLVLELWESLFMLTPVISTTLASVRKLPIKAGWIGTLLIDEAGQATQQSLTGALFRARKAVVIGDPQQIEPVFTVPSPLVSHFQTQYAVEERFNPITHSAQTLADNSMTTGAWITGKPRVWTGLPLRVHRRCQDPMFSISNEISYDGQMVQGAGSHDVNAIIQHGFGESMWLDITDDAAQGKMRTQEYQALLTCLNRLKNQWPQNTQTKTPLDAYIISPYVDVAQQAREAVKQTFGWDGYKKLPAGTVHTFQGKEADIVFLVLGSKPGQPGARARSWAAAQANLLNVALTRARLAVYVIGATQDWKDLPYFSTLYETLQKKDRVKPYRLPS